MAGLLLLCDPALHPVHHRMKRGFQGIGNGPQTDRGGIQNAPLDAAEVRTLEATIGAEALLRKARLAAKFGNNEPDGLSLQVRGLNLALAPLYRNTSWWYGGAYKPTAYTPHLQPCT